MGEGEGKIELRCSQHVGFSVQERLQMGLREFLRKDSFSHDREAMLMHKLVYDCRLVFAKQDSRLQVLTGEVDHDGFDIVFDDGDVYKRFQVKVAFGGTASWEIHRRLLRPTPDIADYFGFESSPEGIGIAGGVILQLLQIESTGELTVKYCYTDLDILRAFHLGIIRREHPNSQKTVCALFDSLKREYGKIDLPRGAFLEAKGPSELLALAGFNTGDTLPWIWWLRNLSGLKGYVSQKEIKLPADEERTKMLVRESILKLTSESL
jgi:hypothetical protein